MRQPTNQEIPRIQRKRRLTVRAANFSLMVSREDDVETIAVYLDKVSLLDRPALAMLWQARVRLRGWGDKLEFLPPASEAVQHFIDRVRMGELLYGAGPA